MGDGEAMTKLEWVARALATDHYCLHLCKASDNPHVVANVDANWFVFSSQAGIAIEAVRSYPPGQAQCDRCQWPSICRRMAPCALEALGVPAHSNPSPLLAQGRHEQAGYQKNWFLVINTNVDSYAVL